MYPTEDAQIRLATKPADVQGRYHPWQQPSYILDVREYIADIMGFK